MCSQYKAWGDDVGAVDTDQAAADRKIAQSRVSRMLHPETYAEIPGVVPMLRLSYWFDFPVMHWFDPPEVEDEYGIKYAHDYYRTSAYRLLYIVGLVMRSPIKDILVAWMQAEVDDYNKYVKATQPFGISNQTGQIDILSPIVLRERILTALTTRGLEGKVAEEAGIKINTIQQQLYRAGQKSGTRSWEESNYGIRVSTLADLSSRLDLPVDFLLGTKWQFDHLDQYDPWSCNSWSNDSEEIKKLNRLVMQIPYTSLCTLRVMLRNEEEKNKDVEVNNGFI